MNHLDFSLIIACYNEEKILKESIAKITNVFNVTNLKYEIIFVDDKSSDNTVKIVKEILNTHPGWRIIEHKENTGRGKAVSDGIKASNAPIIGFIDIDLSTMPWYLPRLIDEVRNGADIATAMRVYKLKPRTLFRLILSKGYNFFMRLLLSCNLRDTETGCKVFNKNKILPVLDKAEYSHWFWDTEIMLYSYVAGYRIVEVPTIFIREGLSTTVRIFKDTKDYLINLIKFRCQLRKMRKNGF
jgi:glycosyltransferase involved in cell wall biosynthesis